MGVKHAPPKDLALDLSGRTLADIPVPSGREEEWRFTPMRRLIGLAQLAEAGVPVLSIEAPEPVRFSHHAVDASGFRPADRIAVAALELGRTMTVIEVPEDALLADPIVVSHRGEAVTASVLRIEIGRHARATVVIDVTGSGQHAVAVQVVAAAGADVTLVQVSDGDRDQVYAAQHDLRIGADAVVRHVAVTLGGDLVRLVTTAQYEGQGGSLTALGVFFTDAGQHHEHRLFVDHNAPHCASDVQYKGALQGADAHAVWIGDVLIRAEAVGTRTYEMNRNLVLTEGARADSVPNLEIETGDVTSAGHASATGRFDEEQLFYLLSRGIPLVEAKRLVVRGFIGDLVARIPVASLRDRCTARVEQRLGDRDPRFTFEDES